MVEDLYKARRELDQWAKESNPDLLTRLDDLIRDFEGAGAPLQGPDRRLVVVTETPEQKHARYLHVQLQLVTALRKIAPGKTPEKVVINMGPLNWQGIADQLNQTARGFGNDVPLNYLLIPSLVIEALLPAYSDAERYVLDGIAKQIDERVRGQYNRFISAYVRDGRRENGIRLETLGDLRALQSYRSLRNVGETSFAFIKTAFAKSP